MAQKAVVVMWGALKERGLKTRKPPEGLSPAQLFPQGPGPYPGLRRLNRRCQPPAQALCLNLPF